MSTHVFNRIFLALFALFGAVALLGCPDPEIDAPAAEVSDDDGGGQFSPPIDPGDGDGTIDEVELPCDNPEDEDNDDPQSANELTMGGEICGLIELPGDVDWYAIEVSEWSVVEFELVAASIDSSLHPILQIRGPDGETIQFTTGEFEDEVATVLFGPAATYFVSVSDLFSSLGGVEYPYILRATEDTSRCDVVEQDDSGDLSEAIPLAPGETACGHISGGTDYDYFSFTAQADETLSFELVTARAGSSLNSQLALFDTDGQTLLVLDEPFAPEEPRFSYTFEAAGTYYLEATSDMYMVSDVGTYMLGID